MINHDMGDHPTDSYSKYAHVFNQVCEIIDFEAQEILSKTDELNLKNEEIQNAQKQV